jgi:hypothetical protein
MRMDDIVIFRFFFQLHPATLLGIRTHERILKKTTRR